MADTLDVLTLEEAKRAINLDLGDDDHDTELAAFVTAVSRRLDALVGPVVIRTITGERHPGGGSIIFPHYTPISSITSVTEYSSGTAQLLAAETATVSTAYDYLLTNDGQNVQLSRRSSWSDTYFAASEVRLTYVAGRYANTAAVDARFKTAAAMMLGHLWRKDQGAGNVTFGAVDVPQFVPGFAVPNAVVELLADQMLAPAVA